MLPQQCAIYKHKLQACAAVAKAVCPHFFAAAHTPPHGAVLQGGNVGRSLAKSTMTFAVNVTASPDDVGDNGVWNFYSPLSRLLAIASVNNKASFQGEEDGSGERKARFSLLNSASAFALNFSLLAWLLMVALVLV